MNVPRPLLILVLIVIVLGLVSCAVGVGRGVAEDEGDPPDPDLQAFFRDLLEPPLARLSDVQFGNGCTLLPPPARVNAGFGGCTMRLRGPGFGSHKLEFTPASGATVTVAIEVSGEVSSESDTLGAGETGDVSTSGSDVVTVNVACFCTVTLGVAS